MVDPRLVSRTNPAAALSLNGRSSTQYYGQTIFIDAPPGLPYWLQQSHRAFAPNAECSIEMAEVDRE